MMPSRIRLDGSAHHIKTVRTVENGVVGLNGHRVARARLVGQGGHELTGS